MQHGSAPPLSRPRPSAGDRERTARRLRHACEHDRLSLDTFAARLDLVYEARSHEELDRLLSDVVEPGLVRRAVLGVVTWLSRLGADVGAAWRSPRLPRLALPERAQVVIGRGRLCDFLVADPTVSHRHALLAHADGRWAIRDLGSTNGTFVNGWRVVDEVEVRPGDVVALGAHLFVAAPPLPARRSRERRFG